MFNHYFVDYITYVRYRVTGAVSSVTTIDYNKNIIYSSIVGNTIEIRNIVGNALQLTISLDDYITINNISLFGTAPIYVSDQLNLLLTANYILQDTTPPDYSVTVQQGSNLTKYNQTSTSFELSYNASNKLTIDSAGLVKVASGYEELALTGSCLVNKTYVDSLAAPSTNLTVTTINNNYAALTTDDVILSNGVIPITITLFSATIKKKQLTIKKTDSTNKKVKIQPFGTEKIDGKTSMEIAFTNSSITLQSNGFNWFII